MMRDIFGWMLSPTFFSERKNKLESETQPWYEWSIIIGDLRSRGWQGLRSTSLSPAVGILMRR